MSGKPTKPTELSQKELDDELQELDEKGQQDSKRFQALYKEAEDRGLL